MQRHVAATQQLGQMSNEELRASVKRATKWANDGARELKRREEREKRARIEQTRMRAKP